MKLTKASKTLATVFTVALTQLGFTALATDNTGIPGVTEQPASYFYTGKPYDSDLGSYVFSARNYNPEVNRWTSADPSGFPDGANSQHYAPIPTTQFDPTGLSAFNTETYDLTILLAKIDDWNANGLTFAANALLHFAGNTGTTYTGSSNEAAMIKNADKYRTAAQSHFNSLGSQYLAQGDGTYNIGTAWDGNSLANLAFESRWLPSDDGNLFNALGGAHYLYSGTLTVANGKWSADVNMEQADWYTFQTGEGRIAAILNAPPSGRAAWDLEVNYDYHPFWNHETWQDHFTE